jgi:hypothetical protein
VLSWPQYRPDHRWRTILDFKPFNADDLNVAIPQKLQGSDGWMKGSLQLSSRVGRRDLVPS